MRKDNGIEADPYGVLGVEPRASTDAIRAAYRALAWTLHPDLGGDGYRMARLNAAWSLLRDPVLRAEYDARHVRHALAVPEDGTTILDFGRYAGSSIKSLARRDPNYLEWLARTQIGRPLRREIDEELADRRATVREPKPAKRRRWFGRG